MTAPQQFSQRRCILTAGHLRGAMTTTIFPLVYRELITINVAMPYPRGATQSVPVVYVSSCGFGFVLASGAL